MLFYGVMFFVLSKKNKTKKSRLTWGGFQIGKILHTLRKERRRGLKCAEGMEQTIKGSQTLFRFHAKDRDELFTVYAVSDGPPVDFNDWDSLVHEGGSSLACTSFTVITPTTARVVTAANRKMTDTTRKTSRRPPRRRSLFWRDSTSISVFWWLISKS